jgi:hypothetical protein
LDSSTHRQEEVTKSQPINSFNRTTATALEFNRTELIQLNAPHTKTMRTFGSVCYSPGGTVTLGGMSSGGGSGGASSAFRRHRGPAFPGLQGKNERASSCNLYMHQSHSIFSTSFALSVGMQSSSSS